MAVDAADAYLSSYNRAISTSKLIIESAQVNEIRSQAVAAEVLEHTSHDGHSANSALESHTFKFATDRSDNLFREHGKVVKTC